MFRSSSDATAADVTRELLKVTATFMRMDYVAWHFQVFADLSRKVLVDRVVAMGAEETRRTRFEQWSGLGGEPREVSDPYGEGCRRCV